MIAEAFYDHLIQEITHNTGNLSDVTYQTLRRYYNKLAVHPEQRDFYCYNWVRRTEPLAHLLTELPVRSVPWRILDAGCGVGTEALFLAHLRPDVEVWGVDLNVSRLTTAHARKDTYAQLLGRALPIHFEQHNVFDILQEMQFDVVWTMEAISHIDPAEDFIQAVVNSLPVGGYLIMSDSHIINPAIAWRIWQMRRQGVAAHTHKTTETGETVAYAQERMFAVWQVRQMLQKAGFSTPRAQLSVFFPPVAARFPHLFPLLCRADRILNHLPFLRYVGGVYTITAQK